MPGFSRPLVVSLGQDRPAANGPGSPQVDRRVTLAGRTARSPGRPLDSGIRLQDAPSKRLRVRISVRAAGDLRGFPVVGEATAVEVQLDVVDQALATLDGRPFLPVEVDVVSEWGDPRHRRHSRIGSCDSREGRRNVPATQTKRNGGDASALENAGVDLGQVDVLARLVRRKVGVEAISLLVVVVVFRPVPGTRTPAARPGRHHELGVLDGLPVGGGRRRVHVAIDVQVGVTVVDVVVVDLLVEIFVGLTGSAVVHVVDVAVCDEGMQGDYRFVKNVLIFST